MAAEHPRTPPNHFECSGSTSATAAVPDTSTLTRARWRRRSEHKSPVISSAINPTSLVLVQAGNVHLRRTWADANNGRLVYLTHQV